jgi:hypothetical protein
MQIVAMIDLDLSLLCIGGRDANVIVYDNKFVLQQTMSFFAGIS